MFEISRIERPGFAPQRSGVVAGDTGICLQNRGAGFVADPEHPNALAPGKRPFHTIIPAMIVCDGKPWLCYGVMGGDMQAQGHVQGGQGIYIDWERGVLQGGSDSRKDGCALGY